MTTENQTQSLASQITGTQDWLQLFGDAFGGGAPAGGDGAPASAPAAPASAPVGAPEAATSATPAPAPVTHAAPFRGGFRVPGGPNPLLAPAAPAPAQAPAITTPQTAAPLAAPAQTPIPAAPAAPEVLDFSGRQVPVPTDPAQAAALRQLHFDYRQQQSHATRLQQENARLRQTGAQPPAQAAPQPTPQAGAPQQQPGGQGVNLDAAIQQALAGVDAEQWMPGFYANPGEAIGGLLKQALGPVISQVTEQIRGEMTQQTASTNQYVETLRLTESFSNELATMAANPQQYPDLDAMKSLMGEVLTQNPYLYESPNPMAAAYRMARGYGAGGTAPQAAPVSQPAPLTADAVMGNQEVLSALLQRPEVINSVVQSYVRSLQQGAAPMMIGTAPGGVPPAVPPTRPTNIREAGLAARQFLGVPVR